MLLRDDDGQASVCSKVRLRSGRVLEARTHSFSYSSAARRSTFLYLKERERERERGSEEERGKNSRRQGTFCLPLLCSLSIQLKSSQTVNLPCLKIKKHALSVFYRCHFTSPQCQPTALHYRSPLVVHKTSDAFIIQILQSEVSPSCSHLLSCDPLLPAAQYAAKGSLDEGEEERRTTGKENGREAMRS